MADYYGATSKKWVIQDILGNIADVANLIPTGAPASYFSLSTDGTIAQTSIANASGLYDSTSTLYPTNGNSWASANGQVLQINGGAIVPVTVETITPQEVLSSLTTNVALGGNSIANSIILSATNPFSSINALQCFASGSVIYVTIPAPTTSGFWKTITLQYPHNFPMNLRFITAPGTSVVPYQDGTVRLGTSIDGLVYTRILRLLATAALTWQPFYDFTPNYFPLQSLASINPVTGLSSPAVATPSIAVSGDGLSMAIGLAATVVIPGAGTVYGKVITYSRTTGNTWVAQVSPTFTPSLPTTDQGFGFAVALNADGTVLAITSNSFVTGSNTGALWVYTRPTNVSTVWTGQLAAAPIMMGPLTSAGTVYFGKSVTLSARGDVVAVGIPGLTNVNYTGGAIVTAYNSGTTGVSAIWSSVVAGNPTFPTPLQYTPGYSPIAGARVGHVVRLNAAGNVLRVGAPLATVGANTLAGAIVTFTSPTVGGTFAFLNNKSPATTSNNMYFGWDIAHDFLSQNVFVGAPGYSTANGAVYLVTGTSAAVNNVPLSPTTTAGHNNFGYSVACSENGNSLVVGAPGLSAAATPYFSANYASVAAGTSANGDVYAYLGSGGTYTLQAGTGVIVTSANNFNGASIGCDSGAAMCSYCTGIATTSTNLYAAVAN